MAKEPKELKWVEDLFPEGYRRKSMFGGFAYYLEQKIVMLSFEGTGSRSYKGQKYPFEIWNGCMFPVEHIHQAKALKRFPFLVSHPILPKWLYLPLETENFDDQVTEVLAQAVRPLSYWGSVPKERSKKKPAPKTKTETLEKIDTRRPRMFSDEPIETKLTTAQKISDLKNLGPVAQKQFDQAGIKTVKTFIQLGWKTSLLKLIEVNDKNRHSIMAYTLIGAITNKEWNGISEEEKKEARDFVHSLPKPTKKKKK